MKRRRGKGKWKGKGELAELGGGREGESACDWVGGWVQGSSLARSLTVIDGRERARTWIPGVQARHCDLHPLEGG